MAAPWSRSGLSRTARSVGGADSRAAPASFESSGGLALTPPMHARRPHAAGRARSARAPVRADPSVRQLGCLQDERGSADLGRPRVETRSARKKLVISMGSGRQQTSQTCSSIRPVRRSRDLPAGHRREHGRAHHNHRQRAQQASPPRPAQQALEHLVGEDDPRQPRVRGRRRLAPQQVAGAAGTPEAGRGRAHRRPRTPADRPRFSSTPSRSSTAARSASASRCPWTTPASAT